MFQSRNQGLVLHEDNRLASQSSISPCRSHVGCAGWSIPRDEARHFPDGPSHLERYARVFNACEINSSFYRPHKNATWQRWGESVPPNFRFAVKAPRTITHESKLKCGAELLSPFIKQISFLEDRLGPVLFQLPPGSEYESGSTRRFLSLLRGIYPGHVVWEPRHRSWFDQEADQLLTEFRIARVAADPACVSFGAEPAGWPSLVYFRLHGSPRRYYSSYSDEFLNTLASQMAKRTATGQVWCVFDNTAAGYAVPNAIALREKLAAIEFKLHGELS